MRETSQSWSPASTRRPQESPHYPQPRLRSLWAQLPTADPGLSRSRRSPFWHNTRRSTGASESLTPLHLVVRAHDPLIRTVSTGHWGTESPTAHDFYCSVLLKLLYFIISYRCNSLTEPVSWTLSCVCTYRKKPDAHRVWYRSPVLGIRWGTW